MEGDVRWPLGVGQRALLRELAKLLAQDGARRWPDASAVAGDVHTEAKIDARTEAKIREAAGASGLGRDAALDLVLAVQATVREDVVAALDKLAPAQAIRVAAWCEVLGDHRAELRDLLGRTDAEAHNHGRSVYRYAETYGVVVSVFGMIGGFVLAVAAWLALRSRVSDEVVLAILLLAPTLGALGGFDLGRRRSLFRCTGCRHVVKPADDACDSCGGHIAGEIADHVERDDELASLGARAITGRSSRVERA
jgi:hypothetical protein